MTTTMTPAPLRPAGEARPTRPLVQDPQPSIEVVRSRPPSRPRVPIGHDAPRAALAAALDAARSGRSAAILLRGQLGSGKTLLLDDAVSSAVDCRVLRSVGIEAEQDLRYSALQLLCARLTEAVGELPPPQAAALGVALGLIDGPAPDQLLVGLGLVSLLAQAAEAQPVVCLVDDAQWLDAASAHAFGFAARHLDAAGVAVAVAVRGDERLRSFSGIDEVRLQPLSAGEMRLLLSTELPGKVRDEVRERILDEARGNPLAVVQLARAVSVGDLAGGFAVGPRSLDLWIEDLVGTRLPSLAPGVGRAVLLAATEPHGDAGVFRSALAAADGAVDVESVEATGLLEVGESVRFVHPLVRHHVYRLATPNDRRAAHAVLAEVVPEEVQEAWHRAQSLAAPSDEVAAALERASTTARRSGGAAAAAAFLARASILSEESATSDRRALAAATLKHRSGALGDAIDLLYGLEDRGAGEVQHLRSRLVRAEVATSLGRRDGVRELIECARQLAELDPALSCVTYLRAFAGATVRGRLDVRGGVHDVADSARRTRPWERCDNPSARLLATLASWWSGAEVVDLRDLAAAVHEACTDPGHAATMATRTAMELFDVESWEILASGAVDAARRSGEIVDLPVALDLQACLHVLRGDLGVADAAADEAARTARRIGMPASEAAQMLLAAWRCPTDDALEWVDSWAREATSRNDGAAVTLLGLCRAIAHNAAGRYAQGLDEALAVLRSDEPFVSAWAAPEVVEAAVRAGRPADAEDAYEFVRLAAEASGSAWAQGIERRCAALLGEDGEAAANFEASIRHLERSGMTPDLGRAHLLYGEWLRRQKRRVDARTQLRLGLQIFDAIGASGFAARASLELRASGEQARRRSPETAIELTERELQVATLASEGCSNPEIGTQLFISSRTVEYHLGKVFSKLGINSRAQLRTFISTD